MILSVTPNPCIDVTLFVDGLKPHDTNRIQRQEIDAGGKAINLSRVAAELGAATIASGFLGGAPGGQVLEVLRDQGVDEAFVRTAAETRMNFSVEGGQGRPPTTFNARGGPITPAEWDLLLSVVKELAADAEWVALGGSLPVGVPVEAYAILGKIAKDSGAKLLIDADKDVMLHGLSAGPDLIKPNRREAERLLGHPVSVDTALDDCRSLLALMDGSDDPVAILSLGGKGAVLCSRSCELFCDPAPITPKSTIGSGDSLLGGFLAGLSSGLSISDAFALGNAAGAATALTDGTEIARRDVVDRMLPQVRVHPAG